MKPENISTDSVKENNFSDSNLGKKIMRLFFQCCAFLFFVSISGIILCIVLKEYIVHIGLLFEIFGAIFLVRLIFSPQGYVKDQLASLFLISSILKGINNNTDIRKYDKGIGDITYNVARSWFYNMMGFALLLIGLIFQLVSLFFDTSKAIVVFDSVIFDSLNYLWYYLIGLLLII